MRVAAAARFDVVRNPVRPQLPEQFELRAVHEVEVGVTKGRMSHRAWKGIRPRLKVGVRLISLVALMAASSCKRKPAVLHARQLYDSRLDLRAVSSIALSMSRCKYQALPGGHSR